MPNAMEAFALALQAAGFISPTMSVINAIRDIRGTDVISALFDAQGQRVHGEERISVERHDQADGSWWYSVDPVEGYTFTRIPLIASGLYEELGHIGDAVNADANYWRWATPPPPGRIAGGNHTDPNALVQFIVVGYKADALLEHFSSY